MSNKNNEDVVCEEHGERAAALVCEHLFSGKRRGFHCAEDPENPDATCPDAWCDACDTRIDEAGDFTDDVIKHMALKVVCTRCYENLRECHWRQDDRAFERLSKEAFAYLESKQDRITNDFRLGEYERYDWYQERGELVFSHGGKPRVVATIQFVGSVSTRSDTWLWAWANDSLLENVKARTREVREYGKEQSLLKLAAAHWDATEGDGWEMTAIAAYLLGAVGAYRAPGDEAFTFMVMTHIDWAQ